MTLAEISLSHSLPFSHSLPLSPSLSLSLSLTHTHTLTFSNFNFSFYAYFYIAYLSLSTYVSYSDCVTVSTYLPRYLQHIFSSFNSFSFIRPSLPNSDGVTVSTYLGTYNIFSPPSSHLPARSLILSQSFLPYYHSLSRVHVLILSFSPSLSNAIRT